MAAAVFLLIDVFKLVGCGGVASGDSFHVRGERDDHVAVVKDKACSFGTGLRVTPSGVSILCPKEFIVCILESCEEDLRVVKFSFCDSAVGERV